MRKFATRAGESAFLWAAAIVAAFYAIIAQEAFADSWLRRYTSAHEVEYVIVFFFVWGLLEVAFRMANYPREWRALSQLRLTSGGNDKQDVDADTLRSAYRRQPAARKAARYGQFIGRALDGINERMDEKSLRAFIRELFEDELDRSHANYSLVRFIVWLAPVLGFLGTVIHFGTALSGLSPDTIANQLSHIVGEMGTAFNTTTVALAVSTTMMFALFLGERLEAKLVRDIHENAERELLTHVNCLVGYAADSPIGQVLQPLRMEVEPAVRAFIEGLNAIAERHLTTWQTEFSKRDAAVADRDALVRGLTEKLLQQATRVATSTEAFQHLCESHDQLARIESGLAQNLAQIRESQNLDQVVHQLTAAVHLLTARQRSLLGVDSRAA